MARRRLEAAIQAGKTIHQGVVNYAVFVCCNIMGQQFWKLSVT